MLMLRVVATAVLAGLLLASCSDGESGAAESDTTATATATGPAVTNPDEEEPEWLAASRDAPWTSASDVADLRPAEEIDGLNLYVVLDVWPDEIRSFHFLPERMGLPEVVGAPCGGATSSDSCEAAMQGLRDELWTQPALVDPGCIQSCELLWMTASSGDEVFVVTAENLLRALAPIDTPSEVALVLGTAARVTEVDGGYEAVTSDNASDCDPVTTDVTRWSVLADGTTSVLDETRAIQEGACI